MPKDCIGFMNKEIYSVLIGRGIYNMSFYRLSIEIAFTTCVFVIPSYGLVKIKFAS